MYVPSTRPANTGRSARCLAAKCWTLQTWSCARSRFRAVLGLKLAQAPFQPSDSRQDPLKTPSRRKIRAARDSFRKDELRSICNIQECTSKGI